MGARLQQRIAARCPRTLRKTIAAFVGILPALALGYVVDTKEVVSDEDRTRVAVADDL